MTGVIGQLKKQFDELKNKLENALMTPKTGEERRKRDAEEVLRVKRADEAAAEPEPEPEPEGDEYYCIKKTLGGNTVKSCLPKVLYRKNNYSWHYISQSVADPLKMACGLIPSAGTVCVCNNEDLCNSGQRIRWSWFLIIISIGIFWNRV